MDMKIKNLLYLKDGKIFFDLNDNEYKGPIQELIRKYNDNGLDGLIVYDLSNDDAEHDKNLITLRKISDICELPIYGGGSIKRLEDVKKLLYAGCSKVILNGASQAALGVLSDAAKRFGKDKLIMSLKNVDLLFKIRDILGESLSGFIVMSTTILSSVKSLSDLPIALQITDDSEMPDIEFFKEYNFDSLVSSQYSNPDFEIMDIKNCLAEKGVPVSRLVPKFVFSDFKVDDTGLIPVIVQDYKTKQVLMMAYMNEESYNLTIKTGKMTYFSRSRQKIWVKGEESGHTQYVKELIMDCDNDTLLAKVSQVGGIACHTGAPSCFFNEIFKREYQENNPLKILEKEYDIILDRKNNPKEGSYTNYLFDKGLDKILKKVGEEASEIIIAAKNTEKEEIKYEMADFLYHMMVLMVEKGLTWDDIAAELSKR